MKQGWKLKTLGDVCITAQGVQIPKIEQHTQKKDGMKRYLYISDFRHDRKMKYVEDLYPKKIVSNKDIVVSNTGSFGEVFKGIDGILSNNLFKVSFDKSEIFINYLFYFLKSNFFVEFQEEIKRGTANPHMGHKNFALTPFPVPPLEEQKQIVAKLDQCFEAIDKARANAAKNLENAKELSQSKLNELFSKADSTWKNITLLELLERGWITSHLDGNHGGNYPRKSEFVDSGIPYISANCLVGGEIDFKKAKYLTKERALLLRKGIARNNDVLFAHNATVGPTALLKTDQEKIILSTSLTYYRCNPDFINPEYLLIYLRSREFVKQYESVMSQSTRNQVPITKQRSFYHIIPPIEEQNDLAPKLNEFNLRLDKLVIQYSNELVNLEELKKSILQKAFEGEL
jgi:type I restriction enzyme S subunit